MLAVDVPGGHDLHWHLVVVGREDLASHSSRQPELPILFLASIWAYAKIGTSGMRWLVVGGALATCSLFLSGFSFLTLFPLGLIALGVGITRGP